MNVFSLQKTYFIFIIPTQMYKKTYSRIKSDSYSI